MKTRTSMLLLMIFVAVIVLIASGVKEEELYGTWVNYEYKGSTPPFFMTIFKSDGTYQDYRLEASAWEVDVEKTEVGWINAGFGPYEIMEKWNDEDGATWYKIEHIAGANEKHFDLILISDSGNTLEIMIGRKGYPEKLDPTDVKYRIYYRQE